MSVHTYQSAIAAFREFNPDYFFAGTCFLTASHPEKAYQDLEGPAFPGDITRRLEKEFGESVPIVIAIGGIDETNCQVPIQYGAGGVAAIRAISQSSDPENIVRIMKDKMKRAMFF
jgi:thiamine monophosphate synthase